MKISTFAPGHRDECAQLWWNLYRDLPYVHRPDGYQNVNSPDHIDPAYFLRHLDAGLSGPSAHWHGAVREDTIFLARDGGKIVGLMVCSVDEKASKGSILSAYMQRDRTGRHIAAQLVERALLFFAENGLDNVVAAPDVTKSMEVESPIHLALLDAGFGWTGELTQWVDTPAGDDPHVNAEYGTYLGGSLESFRVGSEIERRMDELKKEGITIETYPADHFDHLGRIAHAYLNGRTIEGIVTLAALHHGQAVGLLGEVETYSDSFECGTSRIMGGCVPVVVPQYRGRGIGKVLYHLGMAEVVRQGAQCGWTATGVTNHARSIYQSIGYENWYLAFGRLQKISVQQKVY
ncbi:MAG: hypothetical protein GKR89_06430 [Candidatus Latescibacteria bacterium]|nr:hypothetical protein [Candidatus Latescibacterota bacterium]